MPEQTNRRATERFSANADTSCSFISPVMEDFGPAKIKNLSMDGIGLVLGRRVEPGTLLAITISNAARGFTKSVLVRVVHVTAQPGAFLVGGTFPTPLTYQELTML